jgi:hypothetical protein
MEKTRRNGPDPMTQASMSFDIEQRKNPRLSCVEFRIELTTESRQLFHDLDYSTGKLTNIRKQTVVLTH